jgi:tRNA1(Val) A37 N6-methylase TrmN6
MGERISIELGDLRDASALGGLDATMDLVTGTPPYFPPDTALDAADAQRAYARIEYRGGVEAYLATASRLVAADGVVVICGDARAAGRVERAAAPLGLAIVGDCPIVAQAGKPPLFALWTLAREGRPRREATLTLRTETGERTADAEALRVFSGFSGRSEG